MIAAPVPITVRAQMAQGTAGVDLKDFSEVFPAFFIMIALPLSCSVGDGPAAGFIMAAVLLLRLIVVRGGMS